MWHTLYIFFIPDPDSPSFQVWEGDDSGEEGAEEEEAGLAACQLGCTI